MFHRVGNRGAGDCIRHRRDQAVVTGAHDRQARELVGKRF